MTRSASSCRRSVACARRRLGTGRAAVVALTIASLALEPLMAQAQAPASAPGAEAKPAAEARPATDAAANPSSSGRGAPFRSATHTALSTDPHSGYQPYVPPDDSLLNLNLPRLGDAGGADLSPDAERRLGDAIIREMRSDGDLLDDVEATDFLNSFAARLTDTPPARGFTFQFNLIKDPTMNAFALPGGYICVHTGLFAAAQSESELASVLSHEMGHVIQRHIARMLAQQRQTSMLQLAGLVLGALAARSNPQAAMGAMTMGAGAQQQLMLSFSRDAEREADRVGFEILTSAGFDPNGMVSFFGRLQRASSLYEGANTAPAYLLTHPLTTERIADMQARIRNQRYVQRPDSLGFRLIRAKLGALTDTSNDGLSRTRELYERQLRERTTPDELATWFGIAIVALQQRDFPAAQRALDETRKRVNVSGGITGNTVQPGDPTPALLDRVAVDIHLRAHDPAGALALLKPALKRSPQARSLMYQEGQALIDVGQPKQASKYLEDQLTIYRSDADMWRLLAAAYSAQGNDAQAHRASAEQYALNGGWMAAIEQLKMAQRSPKLDFYTASQVDSRLQELQAIYAREKQDRNGR